MKKVNTSYVKSILNRMNVHSILQYYNFRIKTKLNLIFYMIKEGTFIKSPS